jgi:DNA-binding CsgD family transcriptional regulator
MTGAVISSDQRGKIEDQIQSGGEIDHRFIEFMAEFLQQINEIQHSETWISSQDGAEQKVVFKTTIQGTCYTLLSSQVDSENKDVQTTLSPREYEIVRLTSRGMSNKTIAAILEISQWTVNTYIRRIFIKLGVNNRAEMVAIATKLGLLENHYFPNSRNSLAVREFEKLIRKLINGVSIKPEEVFQQNNNKIHITHSG